MSTARLFPVFQLLFAAVLFSTGGVLIKLISLTGPATAGYRCLFSVLFLLLFVRKKNITWSPPQVGGIIACCVGTGLFVLSTKMTTAANAILLQFTSPVYIALFGALYLKERLKPGDALAVLVIFGGMVLFFLDKLTPGSLTGNMLGLCAGLVFAWMTLFLRRQKDGSPVETIFLGQLLLMLLCIPFMIKAHPVPRDWILLPLSGVLQLAFPYVLYTSAIKRVTALNTSLISMLEPVLNPIWVAVFYGERPGKWAMVGGAVVLGVILVRSVPWQRNEKTAVSESAADEAANPVR